MKKKVREAVLINDEGKEIDWIDPVHNFRETKCYWYIDEYRWWKYPNYKVILRLKEE